MDRSTIRPAKVVQYDTQSDSYVVQFHVNGNMKERETIANKLLARPRNYSGDLQSLERRVNELYTQVVFLTQQVKALQKS
jgi:hypothetical protein